MSPNSSWRRLQISGPQAGITTSATASLIPSLQHFRWVATCLHRIRSSGSAPAHPGGTGPWSPGRSLVGRPTSSSASPMLMAPRHAPLPLALEAAPPPALRLKRPTSSRQPRSAPSLPLNPPMWRPSRPRVDRTSRETPCRLPPHSHRAVTSPSCSISAAMSTGGPSRSRDGSTILTSCCRTFPVSTASRSACSTPVPSPACGEAWPTRAQQTSGWALASSSGSQAPTSFASSWTDTALIARFSRTD